MTSSPFHDGERAAQRWAGVPASKGSFIRPFMPDQHRELFEKLPFILVGSVDQNLQPSASLLAGPPGFVRTQPDLLEVVTALSEHDALTTHLRRGTRLGILGIEPHTRRRNRVNGLVVDAKPEAFTLLVEQSFGNCPKYITPRRLGYAPAGARAATQLSTLAERERQLITSADTFFIASAHPQALVSDEPSHGVDVSHRGGPSGFVEVTEGGTLTISDYAGNNLFNTVGNILQNPKVGLLFWDLPTQSLLTLTAIAEPTKHPSNEGSERRLTFHVNGAQYVEGGCALHDESESC